MGHVSTGEIPAEGEDLDVPGRQYRGTGADRTALSPRRLASLGEELAAYFLIRRGARILGRNLRVGRGEVDLVVDFGTQRAVVEVKTIQTGGLDDPTYAFTDAKAQQVRRLARQIGIRRVDLIAVSVDSGGVGIRWAPYVA